MTQISILLTAKDQTKAAFASLNRNVDQVGAGVGKLQNLFAGAFAGVSVAGALTKFITETRNAEQEQAQLAAVVRSTGEAAGWSVARLNEMAAALSNKSTFSEGDINNAQTRLLSYTGIVGEQVPKAMQAVIDMSARLGMDLNQSAETIGKALDIPSQGMTALQRQGFRFSEEQKKLAERLEATGKTAEAQGIILQALESSYGGAAAAARDTFGGAISALQNNIDDLLTGDSGSMTQLKTSVDELNQTLESEATKAAFQTFVGWMTQVTTATINSAAGIVGLISRVQQLRAEPGLGGRLLNSAINAAGAVVNPLGTAYSAASSLLSPDARAQQEYQATVRAMDNQLARAGAATGGGTRAVKSSKGSAKDVEAEAKRAIEALQKQVEKTQELSQVEQVLLDIQRIRTGGGQVTESQKQTLLQLAAQIDSAKERRKLEEQRAADEERQSDAVKALREEGIALTERMRTPLESYNAELERLDGLLKANAISQQTYNDAAGQAREQYDQNHKALLKLDDEVDDFSQRAAGNIQDQLGEGLYNLLTGNFDNIGKAWGQLLARMVAEAAAAKLSRAMFGDLVQGGSGDGLFGSVLRAFGGALGLAGGGAPSGDVLTRGLNIGNSVTSAGGDGLGAALAGWGLVKYDVGTNYVPQDMLAMVHKGEKIVPAKYNRAADPDVARPAAALTFAPVIQIDSRSDRAAVQADTQRAVSQALREYTEQLKRTGVIPS